MAHSECVFASHTTGEHLLLIRKTVTQWLICTTASMKLEAPVAHSQCVFAWQLRDLQELHASTQQHAWSPPLLHRLQACIPAEHKRYKGL